MCCREKDDITPCTDCRHFFEELRFGVEDTLSLFASIIRRTKSEQRRRLQASPHHCIDTKVRALSTIQFNLASAVGEVHRHAGLVAAAWGNSNSERFEAGFLQRTLHESLEGLLKTMQTVIQSKSSVPSNSQHATQQDRLPGSQSPLSKAVNTEFSRKQHFSSKLGDGRPANLPFLKNSKSNIQDGIDDIWQLVYLLECEGSRASSSAKSILAANTKPGKWKRRWILYSMLASAVGVLSYYTIRNSRLCGSDNLENMMQNIFSAISRFWNTHAAIPLKEIRAELSIAFEQSKDVVGVQQLESSKASLDRMLTQYTAQATKPGYSAALYRAYRAVGGGSSDEGSSEQPDPFALVTARVEEELKSPLQNMLGGDLMQLLLIQTQVMKVDMESALMQMDQIMRANRLNFSLMACMPAVLVGSSFFSIASTSIGTRNYRTRTQSREDMRMLLGEAERALAELTYSRNKSFASGMLLYALNTLFQSVQKHRNCFSPAEWRAVRLDIMTMSDNEVPVESKLNAVARLARVKAFVPEPHRVPQI
uniref:Nuclear control of ATP synthase 2 n=1 Tax=Micromonas pusilla TaxID=38833 RepID=A0A7S0ID35_MICPS|mmetsp:Transcript_2498/g.10118  ORF Transcript_2498/g.10118 Transcript_2498/m.10118 type:complete len:537 (+) Transcript_2498:511-2121(+)